MVDSWPDKTSGDKMPCSMYTRMRKGVECIKNESSKTFGYKWSGYPCRGVTKESEVAGIELVGSYLKS